MTVASTSHQADPDLPTIMVVGCGPGTYGVVEAVGAHARTPMGGGLIGADGGVQAEVAEAIKEAAAVLILARHDESQSIEMARAMVPFAREHSTLAIIVAWPDFAQMNDEAPAPTIWGQADAHLVLNNDHLASLLRGLPIDERAPILGALIADAAASIAHALARPTMIDLRAENIKHIVGKSAIAAYLWGADAVNQEAEEQREARRVRTT